MRARDIQEGGVYVAKVSGKLTRVRVDEIREAHDWLGSKSRTVYLVTNLRTGRKITFRSAQRFKRAAEGP